MAKFFNRVSIIEPLDAREAFYGGRTNATALYHKVTRTQLYVPHTSVFGFQVKNGEKIMYIDVLSLYPYICKYGRFPVGHPKIITENFELMDSEHMPYEGLVKCKVLPPTDLLHPVLPFRGSRKKLLFPLCRTCANNCQQEPCQHSDEERALTGAWVTLELKKALELGYRILEVFEVRSKDKLPCNFHCWSLFCRFGISKNTTNTIAILILTADCSPVTSTSFCD